MSNRHSECADCHNPHTATDARERHRRPRGWTAPGRLDTRVWRLGDERRRERAPRPTRSSTAANGKVTLEYQLCLKCHSGWTILPANDPAPPLWWAQDKGVELNPANDSFHPIEAAGKNGTHGDGQQPRRDVAIQAVVVLHDSTIRCVNCHGDYRKFDATAPPAAGSDLAPHATPYRGNLMQNYRDRDLKPFTEPYRSNDFALCYMCHAEAPFSDGSGSTGPTRTSGTTACI